MEHEAISWSAESVRQHDHYVSMTKDHAALREARNYGSVELADQAKAHLGDNILNGAITIQQLNLMVGEEQAQLILSEFAEKQNNGTLATTVDTIQRSKSKFQSPGAAISAIHRTLFFREESFRMWDIKAAHKETFNWIFNHSSFTDWLQNGTGCYWVSGKAGSGKSTFMKHAIGHPRTKQYIRRWVGTKSLVSASYFFWRVGTPLQRSHEGILRSLLHQILDKRPNLTPIVFPKLFLYLLLGGSLDSLNLSELQHAVESLLTAVPEDLAIFLAIDGVDEYDGDQFDFCKLLARISSCPSIKVLVSSRPIPSCHHIFSIYPTLRMQDLTVGDIRKYIHAELLEDPLLKEMDHIEPGFATEIEQSLILKASGVFLWIVLVVKNLLIGLGNYEDRDTLLSSIDHLPNDLEKLYDHLFASMDPEHQREGILLLSLFEMAAFQQVHYGMTALQLSFCNKPSKPVAVIETAQPLSQEAKALRVKAVEGRLRSRCRGLLEVQYRQVDRDLEEPEVHYLHRTVAEYLESISIKEKFNAILGTDSLNLQHIILASYAPTLQNLPFEVDKETGISRRLEGITRISEFLHACLVTCEKCHTTGDRTYPDFLEAADVVYMKRCTERQYTLYSIYNNFYLYFITESHPSREYIPPTNFSSDRRIDVAMYFIALSKLTPFWELKLKNTSYEVYSRVGVLLKLLQDVKRGSWTNRQSMVRNIELLIAVTDPNRLASERDNPWNITDEDAIQYVQNNAASRISPWNFWIATRPHSTEFEMRITLALVKAGAELSSRNIMKSGALRSFITQIRSTRPKNNTVAGPSSTVLSELLANLAVGQRPVGVYASVGKSRRERR